ncbi:MAG: cobalamin-dependent protein [Pseudomonadota bacterium]
MSEDQKTGHPFGSLARSGNVTALAGRALSIVARSSGREIQHPDPAWVDALSDAVRAFPEDNRADFLHKAFNAGLTPSVLIDKYIPAAARLFGDSWCVDQLSFADVTIGSARLQAMVRELDVMIRHPEPQSSVLMIVLKDAYHTLGAMVATSQLRRGGVAVRLLLGQDLKEPPNQLENLYFDAVMVSASSTERVETLRELVKYIRKTGHGSVPIIIGGSILDHNNDLKTRTGADYTLNDPIEAAKQCGLMTPFADVGPMGAQGRS